MPQVIACPDALTLKKIALGDLSLADADVLLEHLANCSTCTDQLSSIAADDPLVDAVRSQEQTAADPEKDAVRRLLVKVRGLVAETRSQQDGQTVDAAPSASADNGTGQFSFVDAPQPTEENENDGLAPPQADDEIGRLGPYRILKVLGEGGMGKVFLAEDPALQRQVALKVMKKSLARNLNSRKRFVQEARAAAKIEHDNIIPIYHVNEDRNIPFVAMPLLKGSSLEDILRRKAPLHLKQTLRIGIQIAEGLAAAHASNLIHRDIKPANIWIEPTAGGRVKILDFGLARPTEGDTGLTQSGAILGTPAYMPPEQARGDKVDHRADLYSLGCVLYRMATGELPLKGKDTMSLLMALAMQEPAAPSLIAPTVPKPLSDFIMRLLAKDPAERISTAREAVQALRTIERGDSSGITAVLSESILQPAASLPMAKVVESAERSNPFAFQGAAHEVSAPVESRTSCAAPPRRRRPMVLMACAAAAFLFLVSAGGIIYQFSFQTADGTLLVEVDDKEAEIRFKNGKLEVKDSKGNVYLLSPSDKNKKLPPGDYLIEVADANGVQLDTKAFKLTKNGQTTVHVRVVPHAMAQNGKGTPDDSGKAPSPDPVKLPTFPIATLDHLDPAKIPADERFAWQPKELVAVIGAHRGRHWNRIGSLSFSPDGKTIACAGNSTFPSPLFDAETLQEKLLLRTNQGLWPGADNVVYSSDGKTLVTCNPQVAGLWLWDVTGPEPKKRVKLMAIRPVGAAYSRDGKTLAVDENTVGIRLWDLSGEKPRERVLIKSGGIGTPILAPDGKSLVTIDEAKKQYLLWDISGEQPKERATLPLPSGHIVASFSADSKTLVTLAPDSYRLQLWDLSKPQLGKTPDKTIDVQSIASLAMSPDGKYLAWGGFSGHVCLVDVTGPEPDQIAKIPVDSGRIAFSPDSKSVAAADGPTLRIWDITGPEPRERMPAQGHRATLQGALPSPDGKTLATFDGALLRFWDLTGPTPRLRSEHNQAGLYPASYSPDSKTFASGVGDAVLLWDLTAPTPIVREKIRPNKAYQIRQVSYSPDGKTLALYDAFTETESRIRLWDVSGAEPTERAILPNTLGPFVITPDSKSLICGVPGKDWTPVAIQIWDISGKKPRKTTDSFGGRVWNLALSPDGKTLAHAYMLPERLRVKLWDLSGAKPTERGELDDSVNVYGHFGPPTFAPDGKSLAYSTESAVFVWNVQNKIAPQRLKKWSMPGYVNDVHFAPDGRHLITANANGTAYVLRLTPRTTASDKDEKEASK